MKVRPGYKQSDLGIVPEDWDITTLGVIGATFGGLSGKTKRDFGHGAARYITFMNIMTNVMIDCGTFEPVDVKPTETQNQVAKGDLFFNGSSETPGEVGMCAVLAEDVQGVFLNSFCFGFRLREGAPADGLYLAYYFRSREGRELMKALAQGAIRYNLSKTALLKTRFPLPQRAQQRAIAEALSDADALIESVEGLLAKKRQLKQGAMQDLLRPKPADDVRSLGDVSSLKGRIGWQGLNQTEFTSNGDEPFLITGMNFKDGAIQWSEVYHISEARYAIAPDIQLRSHDVLVTKDGTIGKVLYIDTIPYPGRASLNSHLLLLRPIGTSYIPRYLYYQLGSQRFKNFVELNKSGTTFFGLSQAAVATYPVLLPPLTEQVRIATILTDMDADIAAHEATLAKARQLKRGMMQDLLTGRIRLV